jgi:uncharacterized protein
VGPEFDSGKHTALGRLQHEAANIYITDDDTRGGVQRRRRALRLHVQVRVEQEDAVGQGSGSSGTQHDRARRGHPVCRQASSDIPAGEIDGSGKLPAKGFFSRTGTWIPLLRSGPNGQAESLVPGAAA